MDEQYIEFSILSISKCGFLMATFGEGFRAILRSRGLTQAAAARLLVTTQSVVSYYSNLERPPRRGTLLNIAERLGVSLAELIGEKGTVAPKGLPAKTLLHEDSLPPQPAFRALKNLKKRWKRKPGERATIKHLVAALFPEDADHILAWLEDG